MRSTSKCDHFDPEILTSSIELRDKPRRGAHIVFRCFKSRKGQHCILKNIKTDEYFYLGSIESCVWKHLDGKTTISEIVKKVQNISNDTDAGEIIQFLNRLERNELLEGATPKRAVKNDTSLYNLKVFLMPSDRIATLYRYSKWLFSKKFLVTSIGLIVVVLSLFWQDFSTIFTTQSIYVVSRSTILALLYYSTIVAIPIAIVHEICHALACIHYNVKPGKIGFSLFYFVPTFYVDTSDVWLCDKRARMIISAAGPFSTLLLGCLFFLFWKALPFAPTYFSLYLQRAVYFSFFITVLNLSPFIRLDGYYILMDAIEIPNLMSTAIDLLKGTLRRALRKEYEVKHDLDAGKKTLLTAYGLLSLLWAGFIGSFILLWLSALVSEVGMLIRSFETIGLVGKIKTVALMSFIVYVIVVIIRRYMVSRGNMSNPLKSTTIFWSSNRRE